MKMNYEIVSVLVFGIFASFCPCDGVKCQFCSDSNENRNPICVAGGVPEYLIDCVSGKCFSRVRSYLFGTQGKRGGMERRCGKASQKVGCSTQSFVIGSIITCICDKNGCNAASFVQFNALLWNCIGLVTIFNIRLTTFNEF